MKNLLLIIFILTVACSNPQKKQEVLKQEVKTFDTNTLTIKTAGYKMVRGQLLYLPAYSNIPSHIDTAEYHFDMSAFVAIHNTDLGNKITLQQVLFFNTEGKLVYDFLKGKPQVLEPLATTDFYIPHTDKSGTGANFLIEWTSEAPVNEPLIESITINLRSNNSAAIMSQGRIIREVR